MSSTGSGCICLFDFETTSVLRGLVLLLFNCICIEKKCVHTFWFIFKLLKETFIGEVFTTFFHEPHFAGSQNVKKKKRRTILREAGGDEPWP